MQNLIKESFTGAKSGSGVAEFIINHVPDGGWFFEGFGGKGTISKILENSGASFTGIYCFEINPKTFHTHTKEDYSIGFWNCDSIKWINQAIDRGEIDESDCFYFDPPYRMESRTHQRKYYGKFDWEDPEHKRFFQLIERLNKIGAMVLVSHYPDPVYDEQFKSWNKEDFRTWVRTRSVTERLYWNFDLNEHRLATTAFLGKNFTDRQRIKRKVERMTEKINALPRHERQAIVESLLLTYEC
nr:DNA adenine methylase [uncultured Fluviicola sp.]